jgi:hypothetical protein
VTYEGFPTEEQTPAYAAEKQRANEEGGIPDIRFNTCFLKGEDDEH